MMINEASWLGIRLHTRLRRRTLVCGYYAFMLLIEAAFCWKLFEQGHIHVGVALLPSLLASLTLLGGQRKDAPVKPFSEEHQSRNQWPMTLFPRGTADRGDMNERDLRMRDRIHYQAYSAVRIATAMIAVGFCFVPRQWQPEYTLLSGYPFLLLVMTLPQTIILWTEEEMPSIEGADGFSLNGTAQ